MTHRRMTELTRPQQRILERIERVHNKGLPVPGYRELARWYSLRPERKELKPVRWEYMREVVKGLITKGYLQKRRAKQGQPTYKLPEQGEAKG